ncbi:hypothetical protein [Ancylobacter lacus]|uniref:hypothetical protein n=1 Tax=Ancylobacter lacus TaxID=2579970 RepID=UPI001BD1B935|nr:hypothetical protein [Ancylobacter lacus]MBS7541325.1 hypothetical protein [Ancylobacter lacus]
MGAFARRRAAVRRVWVGAGTGLLLLAGLPAHAADADAGDSDPGYEIDSENIFGFTEGSDTNDRGEQEVSVEATGRFGRAAGEAEGGSHYGAGEAEAEYEYGVTRNLTIGVSAALAYHDISNIDGLEDMAAGGFGGLGAEIKYRFLSWEHAPLGLAVSIEPEWGRYDDDSGERVDSFGLPVRLLMDKELVSETLFGAVNLGYLPEWGGGEAESGLEVSGALSWQVARGLFLGGELRYLAAFDGAGLNRFEGGALYLGPSFYAQLSKAAYVKLAYAYQIAGSSPDSDNNLDLVNHERQQLLLKLGVEF